MPAASNRLLHGLKALTTSWRKNSFPRTGIDRWGSFGRFMNCGDSTLEFRVARLQA